MTTVGRRGRRRRRGGGSGRQQERPPYAQRAERGTDQNRLSIAPTDTCS